MASTEATAAMDKEWNKLSLHRRPDPKDKGIKGHWDIGSVRNLEDVKREARNNGTTIHHGRIAELCTQKNSELPDGHDGKSYKVRDVLFGNHITDEGSKWAVFPELSSSPPHAGSVQVPGRDKLSARLPH